MLKKNLTALLFLSTLVLLFGLTAARAQNGAIAAQNSQVTAAQMPGGSQRLLPESVPAQFNQTFDNILRQGAGKIAGGDREVLVWTGNYKNASSVARLTGQIQTNFRGAGWQYETAGKDGDMEVFSLYKEGSPRRVVLGFFVPGGDVLVCALMEVVKPGDDEPTPQIVVAKMKNDQPATMKNSGSAKVLSVERNATWVNVMGGEMPETPQFPALPNKPGFVRGYVKDTLGRAVAGARLGLKTARMYDAYLAASAETDAKGYYEIKIPMGGARFDYAGVTIEYGAGRAALGLHPADGRLNESYPATTGGVENFVLLPYGIADRDGASRQADYRANYYGGSMLLRYFIGGFSGMLSPGDEIEITLTPEGNLIDGGAGQSFVIRKTVEDSSLGEFIINNVPVGRYRIEVRQAGGKPLRLKQKTPTGSVFGIQPAQANGSASLTFNPLSADAKTAAASRGNWTDLEIIVERP
ncbi:MAG TPA: hypothetical protein VK400_16305 [Pyrinomonadaceae bacterium]|nr:hypothetical protein [Pyrinomonadaceae bacterium]